MCTRDLRPSKNFPHFCRLFLLPPRQEGCCTFPEEPCRPLSSDFGNLEVCDRCPPTLRFAPFPLLFTTFRFLRGEPRGRSFYGEFEWCFFLSVSMVKICLPPKSDPLSRFVNSVVPFLDTYQKTPLPIIVVLCRFFAEGHSVTCGLQG